MNGKNQIIPEEELNQIVGGTFSAEAQEWINRNKDVIYERAGAAKKAQLDAAMAGGQACPGEIGLDTIKTILTAYKIQVDDLV